jgi:hypothetical protein
MPVRVPRRTSVIGWSAIAVALMSLAARADGPRGVEWMSKDAILYLEAAHPGLLLDRVLDPKFQSYLSSIPPYARYLKSDAYTQQQAGIKFVAALLETTPEKGIRDLAGGGVAFGVEGEKGKAPWGFIALTAGDPAFLTKAHAKLLELTRNDAKGKGLPDPVKESEHRGIKLYSMSKDENHAILDKTLVVSQSADAVKTIIDRSLSSALGTSTPIGDWKGRQAKAPADTVAAGIVRLDRLRELDPKKYTIPEMVDPGQTFLFAPWIEAARKAPWVAANITWSDAHLTANVTLPTPPNGYHATVKTYLPPKGSSAPAPLRPKGVIASLSLWRDLSAIWEVRNDLFPPPFVQGLAQLDTFAGQYFDGRDFGTGVLGAISSDWRLVVAEQDYSKMNPVPDLKLPGFALVIDVKPDDDDFAQRLKVAFQSFVGLANLGAAQSKAPPLELVSVDVDGITIASTRFMASKPAPGTKPSVHQRHNFTPSVAQVDNHFILSSSLGLTKDLIPAVREKAKPTDATLLVEASGAAIAKILEVNRQRLVTQNMMEKGNDKATASAEIDLLLGLLRYAGQGTLSAKDGDKAVDFRLDFALGTK